MDEVNLSGPMFDGRAEAAVEAATRDISKTAAQEGKNLVDARLGEVLQHPTGRYEAHIRTNTISPYINKVDDGGRIVYGPWLEGVGSRNAPKTRFRGYATFRIIGSVLGKVSGEIGNRVMEKYIGRMN